jgi:hypothetical protein
VRDDDGKLRRVKATAPSKALASQLLKARIRDRPSQIGAGELGLRTPCVDLVQRWLASNEHRDLAPKTVELYADVARTRIVPAFAHFALGEVTTARVEAFLQAEFSVSYQRAKQSRTLLNQVFKFALRHDAIGRNPVDGTSQHGRPGSPIPAKRDARVSESRQFEELAERASQVVLRVCPAGAVVEYEIVIGQSGEPWAQHGGSELGHRNLPDARVGLGVLLANPSVTLLRHDGPGHPQRHPTRAVHDVAAAQRQRFTGTKRGTEEHFDEVTHHPIRLRP